ENDQPFFIHLSHFAPHFPYQAPEGLVKKYQSKKISGEVVNDPVFAAMVESIDAGIGRIVTALETSEKLHKTLIIVTSDNGWYEDMSFMNLLRGQKSLLYEGGIRIPLLLSWPGHIAQGNSEIPVMGIDLYPTLMQLAGAATVKQA